MHADIYIYIYMYMHACMEKRPGGIYIHVAMHACMQPSIFLRFESRAPWGLNKKYFMENTGSMFEFELGGPRAISHLYIKSAQNIGFVMESSHFTGEDDSQTSLFHKTHEMVYMKPPYR